MVDPLQSSKSPEERAEAGKAARAKAPRSSHGDWVPAPDREDPVELLEGQAVSRVGRLVPLRYGRMLASLFAFYRGAAAVMAADLAGAPRSGFDVQLCGDAHLSNFGAYASPERELVFDVNDFDETLPGPWEWDVMRLAASFAVAGRESGFKGRERLAIVGAMSEEYRLAMRRLSELGNLEVWYTKMDVPAIAERWGAAAGEKEVAAFKRNLAKTQAKDRMRALSKLTREVDGKLRIVSEPPLIVPLDELVDETEADIAARILAILADYRETLPADRRVLLDSYHFVDAALKVVGVGSVGTRAFVVLMLGRDGGDPLFLQVKEAQRSVLEPHAETSVFANQGERVVQGQRLVQSASDILLGWVKTKGIDGKQRDFYVRQLWDQKGSAKVERMDPPALTAYAQICGTTLAHAHARSGDRIAIAAYLGKSAVFDEAIAAFAETYADQNERDYAALEAAAEEGRIEVKAPPA
ncbi:MAG TPA: DUF2252 domain-containing protein [Solirubrobacterales bacterium]|jgi:uncharacterized protein (DUF2252 family)|nr:DUF2252 domain-containing protein [Solirubrobacterales bacterium]